MKTMTVFHVRYTAESGGWIGTCPRWAAVERFAGDVEITKVTHKVVNPQYELCACCGRSVPKVGVSQ